MRIETEIQTDVDALRGRFAETKSLYREVCALLFFRYGITPTANKLYQFVRKGSMSAPADALTQFWDDLRSKARVEIDHPDLPPELKAIAAEAIAGIWRQASAGARAELAELRIELRSEVERAVTESNESHEAAEASRLEVINLEQEVHDVEEARRTQSVELESERRAHAGTAARVQELQHLVDDLRAEQGRQRDAFSADLAQSREAVEQANARADAGERRALLEIDQERQARTRSDKQTEALRGQLAAAEGRQRDEALESADTITRLQAKLNSTEASGTALCEANARLSEEMRSTSAQLLEAQHQAIQFQTEAQTVRSLLDRLAPLPGKVAQTPAPRAARDPKRKGSQPL